jgi:siroheme synthase-like protein
MSDYYPVFLNLKGKKVLLFGGGEVALRKARMLRRSGARLIVVSREASARFLKFVRRYGIEVHEGSFIPEDLSGVFLIVSATNDPDFNRGVYERSERAGIFVNVVDDPKHCTFIAPSIVKRGSLQIAISTGGASPLLAKELRQKLERQFGPEYRTLVQRLKRDRTEAKQRIPLERDRRKHFAKVLESEKIWKAAGSQARNP